MAAVIQVRADTSGFNLQDVVKQFQRLGQSAEQAAKSAGAVVKVLDARKTAEYRQQVQGVADQYDQAAMKVRRLAAEDERRAKMLEAFETKRNARLAERQGRMRARQVILGEDEEKKPAEKAAPQKTAAENPQIFSRIGQMARDSNLFMGHEMQIRAAAGTLDGLAGVLSRLGVMSAGTFAGVVAGAAAAGVAFYKLNQAGSQATKGVLLGVSDLSKQVSGFASSVLSRVASGFDSIYKSAMAAVGVHVNTRAENAANAELVAGKEREVKLKQVERDLDRERLGNAGRYRLQ